ncbi:endolysin [Mycobacterium phage CRB2]|uniref:Lysin A n=1 Tax=Mycobacterium phage CRB2 TaxID=2483623 RepID=A0A455LM17_9CAUD|nr:endolysin [Mycobacterium phage CRB2]AYP70035.1 lysin A [Mycobacterium phage CRB2]
MSFVWKRPEGPLLSEEEIARRVHAVSLKRDLDELATVLALMCIRQESAFWCPWNANDPASKNYPFDSQSDDGRSVAYFQQQNGAPGEIAPAGQDWWGPMSCRMNLECSANTFLERLADDYTSAKDGASAGRFVQRVQGSAFPDAYAKHWDYCWALLHRALAQGVQNPPTPPPVKPVDQTTPPVPAAATIKPNPAWRGDPLYLPELLRAFGLDVSTYTDADGINWDERGHGDFGVIDFVLWHHTGSVGETDEGIAHHPSLGLAANMLIHPNGHVTLTGSGISWNAGDGIWPGVARGEMNQRCIGIECAYGPDPQGNYTIRWPDAQIIAMVAVGAAISWFLGGTLPVDHQIAHKEWAGAENPLGINAQGKPDPGNLDMRWFRGEISKRLAEGPTGVAAIGGTKPVPTPTPPPPPPVVPPSIPIGDAALKVIMEQQLGPWDAKAGRFTGWPQLSGDPEALKVLQAKVDAGTPLTLVDGLAAFAFNIQPTPAKKAPAKKAAKKAPAKKATTTKE